MSRKVEIEMTVEDAKAVRAWQRAKDNIAEFDKQGQKTSKTFGTMMSDQVRGIAATAAGFAGVGSVIGGIVTAANLLRAEYDNLIQRQSAAANANLSFEDALAKASGNALGIFTPQEVRQQALSLATESGITPKKAANIIGSSITSTGVTNQQEAQLALDAARAATVYAPYLDTASLEDLAGVTASTAKRFGISPETAIGFSERGRAQSNVKELGLYTANVSPVINNLTEFGATPAEASALMAMMTQQLGDTSGEPSGTAAIVLLKELRERFGKQQQYQRSDGSFNPIKAIAALQTSPEMQRRFIEGGEFFGTDFSAANMGKGKAIPTIEGLIRSKDSVQSEQMSGSYYAIGDFAQGADTYAQQVAGVRSVTPLSQTKRGFESITEGIQADDQTAVSAIIREQIPLLEQAIGKGSTAQKISGLLREMESSFGENPVAAIDVATGQLQSESDRLRAGRPARYGRRTYRQGGDIFTLPTEEVVAPAAPATAREISIADKLDKLIEVLTTARDVTASTVSAQNAPAVQVNVNGRPARAETRMLPGSRHADLTSPPAPSRVSRVGGN